ncbi:MAG: aspartate aminotransferase family protein [Albidovulum sp.]|nr:aspartate aminotransferase family protein [Albidovulum sp.]
MIAPIMPTYIRADLAFEKGEGCWLITGSGERYLDCGAGIAVASLGHAHPQLVEALKTQAEKLWHTSNLYRVSNQERLASMLVENSFADTVFFGNSGTEATELSVKIARRYWHCKEQPERKNVITLEGAFHGRTIAMISAAGSEKLTEGFEPLAPGFVQIPRGDIDAAEAAVDENTAAFMVEPVLGEGGIVPLEDRYLKLLREICDRHGILLILDEIQCGMGRTGRLFAHEWAGIEPDIMAVAKGIGGGFPLGACMATERAAAGMTAGTHGSTFGGNPLACAVGARVVEIVSDPDFLQDIRKRAGYFRQRLEALVAGHPDIFDEVRGAGLMLGIKCRVPNSDFIQAALKQKILTIAAGDNVVRLLPPLIISQEELADAVMRMDRAASSMGT